MEITTEIIVTKNTHVPEVHPPPTEPNTDVSAMILEASKQTHAVILGSFLL